jgi:hypothetical protein
MGTGRLITARQTQVVEAGTVFNVTVTPLGSVSAVSTAPDGRLSSGTKRQEPCLAVLRSTAPSRGNTVERHETF